MDEVEVGRSFWSVGVLLDLARDWRWGNGEPEGMKTDLEKGRGVRWRVGMAEATRPGASVLFYHARRL